MIAFGRLDAETGVVMLLYLDLAWEKSAARPPFEYDGDLRSRHRRGGTAHPAQSD